MAILHELGFKYPCETEGVPIDPDDEVTPALPGQVIEGYIESDQDIPGLAAGLAINDILRMKEDYPEFVLHYVKFEARKITVQFSLAPPQNGSITGGPETRVAAISGIWMVVLAILAIVSILLVALGIGLRMIRGWVWTQPPPMGDAVVHAKDHETGLGIPEVSITVDGNYEGTTKSSGSIKVENLLEGDHIFEGEIIEGYHAPDPVTATIIKDKQITVDLVYYPDDEPKPTTGFLVVNTHPVKGEIFIDGASYGEAPVGPVELERGKHYIAFGAVDGYITPKQQTAYIHGDETKSIVGEYLEPSPEEEWFEKYLKYALIGGGVIIGGALLIPEVIRLIARRGKRE